MADDSRRGLAERLRPYQVLLASRAHAQMQYRTSFVTDILGTIGVGLAEFAEVWVIFHNVDVLGGLDFTAALLVFALSNLAFSLADMFVGHLDDLPRYIRAGQVDAFYVRPLPLLTQLMTSDLSLRRVGRLSVALVALVVALTTAEIGWSPATVLLIVLTIVSGTAIFAALFTAAGGLQFFLVDGSEFTNAFTYGGQYAAQQSQQVFPDPLADLLDVRHPDRLRRLPPGRRHPRPAGRPPRPTVAGLVNAPRRGTRLDPRRPVLEGRDPSLPRSRWMSIIETRDLVRDFKRTRAVDHLTLAIEPGESVGYIGANGAGKSTTIKMLTGILKPTSGLVRTCGIDPMRDRIGVARRVGVVFGQRSQLWWDLPLRESFSILAAIHRLEPAAAMARTGRLVEQLEMGPQLGTPVRSLSLGQRMRAEIAAALLHSPELLILDEPTIGLDVLSKQRLREFLIAERRERGTTLLLTTHDMGDIERLCDRVLVVDRGRLAFDGTLPGLAAHRRRAAHPRHRPRRADPRPRRGPEHDARRRASRTGSASASPSTPPRRPPPRCSPTCQHATPCVT